MIGSRKSTQKGAQQYLILATVLMLTTYSIQHFKVMSPFTAKNRFENGNSPPHSAFLTFLGIVPSVVNVYGNTPFDSPTLFTLVDGGGTGCSKLFNLRKEHHDINKGLAVLLRLGTCSYKKVIQHAIEAGAELVVVFLEYDDDKIEDFVSNGSEGLSTPELTIINISNKHGVFFKQELTKGQITVQNSIETVNFKISNFKKLTFLALQIP